MCVVPKTERVPESPTLLRQRREAAETEARLAADGNGVVTGIAR